jgi:Fic family protein
MSRRSSVPSNCPNHIRLINDEEEIARREAENGLRQFDEVMRLVRGASTDWRLTPADVRRLNWLAIDGIWASAGHYRSFPVEISNTPHQPPPPDLVPGLLDEMCDYANSSKLGAIHVASYLMWRINWIHPFGDGNGRTSRATSYLALSIGLRMELPGTPTIPDLIVMQRQPYYEALDAADAAWQSGIVDVWQMEVLMNDLLIRQLSSF